MRAGRDLDLIVIEKVMGWKYDPARTFAPSQNLLSAWEMEEYLLSEDATRAAYGEALSQLVFPEGVDGVSPAEIATAFSHASLHIRCLAALRAVGAPSETERETLASA
jgi:ubiquinone biosynthesis protein COQ9